MQFWRADRVGQGFLTLLLLVGCAGPVAVDEAQVAPPRDGEPLTVYVVNYPLQYFAERIGGDGVHVEFPAPVDEDPAFWSPDAETIAAYQQAWRILLNGAGYARWAQRATLPQSKLVDTSAGFRDRYIRVDDGVTHAHGPGGEHTHGEVAFTTWLDPTLAIEQAARPSASRSARAGPIRLPPSKRDSTRSATTCPSWTGSSRMPPAVSPGFRCSRPIRSISTSGGATGSTCRAFISSPTRIPTSRVGKRSPS